MSMSLNKNYDEESRHPEDDDVVELGSFTGTPMRNNMGEAGVKPEPIGNLSLNTEEGKEVECNKGTPKIRCIEALSTMVTLAKSGKRQLHTLARRPGPACRTRAVSTTTPPANNTELPVKEDAKKRTASDVAEGEDVEMEDLSRERFSSRRPISPSPKKRKQGRPPTTYQYVGLAKARKKFLEAKEKEIDLQAEKHFLEEEKTRQAGRAAFSKEALEKGWDKGEARRLVLLKEMEDGAATIKNVATTSKHLKGTFVKALKLVAESIATAARELGSLSATDENIRLERDNEVLKKEVTSLRAEVEEVKRQTKGEVESTDLTPGERGTPPPPLGRNRPNQEVERRRKAKAFADLKKKRAGRAIIHSSSSSSREQSPVPSTSTAGLEMEVEIPAARMSTEQKDRKAEDTGASSTSPLIETLPHNLPKDWGEILGAYTRDVLRQVGEMVGARMEALESRLPPEAPIRPPLGAKPKETVKEGRIRRETAPPPSSKSKEKGGPAKSVAMATQARVPPAKKSSLEENKAGGKNKKKRKEKGGKGKNALHTPPLPPTLPPSRIGPTVSGAGRESAGEGEGRTLSFAEVVGKKKKNKGKEEDTIKREGSRPQARASSTPVSGGGLSPGGKGPSLKKRKPPHRSAAVVLTLPAEKEDSTSYEEIMREARRRVDLKEIEIDHLRIKRAMTGALILEVPGQNSAPRADSLAKRLQDTLGIQGVKISRPVARAELRVTGLENSIDAGEVAAAIADVGKCPITEVKVGQFRPSPGGLKSVWVRVPQAAAFRAAKEGKAKMGWAVVKLELLPTRPIQCYRCLEVGHTRAKCTAEVDRSGKCYRCGQTGHLANKCTAAPKCPLCEDLGRPSSHRLGGKACAPSQPKSKSKKKRAKKSPSKTVTTAANKEGAGAVKEQTAPAQTTTETPSKGKSQEEAMETGQ